MLMPEDEFEKGLSKDEVWRMKINPNSYPKRTFEFNEPEMEMVCFSCQQMLKYYLGCIDEEKDLEQIDKYSIKTEILHSVLQKIIGALKETYNQEENNGT